MVTERVAPKLSVGSPPSGSIILDELLRRYLVYIGLREFQPYSLQEISQFALLAVYRMVEKYGLEGISVKDFWDWVRPGETYSRAMLLPDTEAGRDYHADQLAKRLAGGDAEETVILRGVDNVRQYARRAFLNLVIEDIRAGKRQDVIKGRVQEENRPSVRRSRPDEESNHQLNEIQRDMREQREGADLEAVRFVMRHVEGKMDAGQLRIVQALNDGCKPQELAATLDMDVKSIYKVYRAYKSNCKKMWSRLFGPPD